MSIFDVFINLIESSIYVSFLYFVFQRKRGFITLILFIFLYFMNITIHNYYLLPEFSLTIISNCILFLYAHLLNKRQWIQNLFIVFVINVCLWFSVTLGILVTSLLFTFPFYSGVGYVFLVISTRCINLVICVCVMRLIKKTQILNLHTKKLIYILIELFIISLIYSCCIEILYYNLVFNMYMALLFIFINVLTFFLCYNFVETQKEQKMLLEIQQRELHHQNEIKINKMNQKNVAHLQSWKHDMTYVLSYLKKYIDNKKYNDALKTIDIYSEILNHYNLFVHTNNDIFNSILIEYHESLIQNHIHFYMNMSEVNVPVNEQTYASLLRMLFKKSIHYCKKTEQKVISVSSLKKDMYFYFSFGFSCPENESMMLEKDISVLLSQYDIILNEEYHDGEYKISFLIPLQNQAN